MILESLDLRGFTKCLLWVVGIVQNNVVRLIHHLGHLTCKCKLIDKSMLALNECINLDSQQWTQQNWRRGETPLHTWQVVIDNTALIHNVNIKDIVSFNAAYWAMMLRLFLRQYCTHAASTSSYHTIWDKTCSRFLSMVFSSCKSVQEIVSCSESFQDETKEKRDLEAYVPVAACARLKIQRRTHQTSKTNCCTSIKWLNKYLYTWAMRNRRWVIGIIWQKNLPNTKLILTSGIWHQCR